MGTKFTDKYRYVRSGDRVKKAILPFKEDQGDRYERYDLVQSTDFYLLFFNWKSLTLFILFTLFSVDLQST